MKIEYLEDPDCEECPLIRLYDFSSSDIAALRETAQSLASGQRTEVVLDALSWIKAVGECRFILKVGTSNRGVRIPKPGTPFEMVYASDGWLEIGEKIAPFIDGSGGYQWLNDDGDVNVLLSKNGGW